MDGVDLSIIRSDGYGQFTSVLNNYQEFDKKLQNKLLNARGKISTSSDLEKYSDELVDLERELTLFHCKTIDKLEKEYKDEIDLIGFHGQTIYHNSNEKISKQSCWKFI